MPDTRPRLMFDPDLVLAAIARTLRRLRSDDRGEGVISAAIAVLVMAGIGALMWVGFKAMWQDTEANTNEKVAEIGE